MIHTRLCDLVGIEHPILNAPMGGGDAPGRLAAAVSEAGALGMIGGTTIGGETWLLDEIRVARDHTDRSFGVGFICHLPNALELMHVALREHVPVIALSFADPTPFVAPAHDGGAVVICQVRSVDEAKRAADAGVDAITAEGTEAGGHTGRMSTLPLVPAVVDAVSPVPVLAAGGIADGRGVAAALVLGADGVWIGTRFLATDECGVPNDYKARVLAASGGDTVLTEVFDIAVVPGGPTASPGVRCTPASSTSGTVARASFVNAYSGSGPVATAADYSAAIWAGEASGFVTARRARGRGRAHLGRGSCRRVGPPQPRGARPVPLNRALDRPRPVRQYCAHRGEWSGARERNVAKGKTMRRIVTCGLVIACGADRGGEQRVARRAAVPGRRRRRRRQPARFDVGAGVESITPPLAGKPAHDPALCTSNPAYNGPHVFSLEEPYIDAAHTGTYEPGDPYVDCNGNGRWDGIILGGGANSPRFASMVADPITTRDRRVQRQAHDRRRGARQRGRVRRVPGADPRQGRSRRLPHRRHLHFGHARRVGSRTRSASPASTN